MSRTLALSLGLAAGGKGPWSPNSAAAAMWLRADKVALGNVSAWPDLTPNGNSPSTGGTAPVNTASSGPKAGQPGVVWSGAATGLTLAHSLVGAKNWTAVTVAKFTDIAAAHCIIENGTSGNGFIMGEGIGVTVGLRDLTQIGDVAISDSTSGASTSYEAWIYECDASGNLTLSVNNVAHTLSTSSVNPIAPGAGFIVGGFAGGVDIMAGDIWEVIIFPAKLGASDRAQLVSYLSLDTGLF